MLKHLPKGPRARDDAEEAAGPTLGGAFRDYGGQRGTLVLGTFTAAASALRLLSQ